MGGFSDLNDSALVCTHMAHSPTHPPTHQQAMQELTGEWALMKALEKDVPTVEKWLADALAGKKEEGEGGGVVGVNGLLLNVGQSRAWKKEFEPKDVSLKALEKDLVDEVWGSAQPPAPGM